MKAELACRVLGFLLTGFLLAACSQSSPTEPSPEPAPTASAEQATPTPEPVAVPTPALNVRYEIIAEAVDPAEPYYADALQLRWATTDVTGYAIALDPRFENSKWEISVELRTGTAWLTMQTDSVALHPEILNTRYRLTIYQNGTAVNTVTQIPTDDAYIDVSYDL